MDEKINVLISFFKTDKSNKQLQLDLFKLCRERNEYDVLLDIYATLIEEKIEIVTDAHFYVLDVLILKGQLENAQRIVDTLDSSNPVVHYFKARLLFDSGQLTPAIELLNSNLSLTAQYDPSQLLHARCFYLESEVQKAIEVLMSINSATVDSAGLLSLCLFDNEQYQAAKEIFEKVLSVNPNQIDALVAKCSYDLYYQNFEELEPKLLDCLSYYPWLSRAWSMLGQYYFVKGKFDEAAESLTKAIEQGYSHIGTWHVLAWCYLFKSQTEQAKKSFSEALNLAPAFADSHGGLAIIAKMEGDLDLARRLCKKALKLDANSYTAQYAQSLILEVDGQIEQAEAIIQKIIEDTNPITGLPHSIHLKNFIEQQKK